MTLNYVILRVFLSKLMHSCGSRPSVFRFPDAKTGGLFDFNFLKGKPDRRLYMNELQIVLAKRW